MLSVRLNPRRANHLEVVHSDTPKSAPAATVKPIAHAPQKEARHADGSIGKPPARTAKKPSMKQKRATCGRPHAFSARNPSSDPQRQRRTRCERPSRDPCRLNWFCGQRIGSANLATGVCAERTMRHKLRCNTGCQSPIKVTPSPLLRARRSQSRRLHVWRGKGLLTSGHAGGAADRAQSPGK